SQDKDRKHPVTSLRSRGWLLLFTDRLVLLAQTHHPGHELGEVLVCHEHLHARLQRLAQETQDDAYVLGADLVEGRLNYGVMAAVNVMLLQFAHVILLLSSYSAGCVYTVAT